MKWKLSVIRAAFIAAGLVSAQSYGQSPPGAPGEPGAIEGGGPPKTSSEAPSSTNPFSPVTPAGDPFGAISTSAIPAELIPRATGLMVGPFAVYPVIGVSQKYDDNIFLSDVTKRASWITTVSPGVRAELRPPGGHLFGVTYKADIANYWNSSPDDYTDHTLLGDANVIINQQARFSLRAEYLALHDPRGSTDRAIQGSPDRWNAAGASGIFSYGTPGAQGRIDLTAGYQHKVYENNRPATFAADRDTTFYGGTFYWRVTPLTSMLFEARRTNINYRLDTSTLDSIEDRAYIGATWEATAKTTGIVKFGYLRKDFDNNLRNDSSGFGWEGRVRWSPLTYSVFELVTQKAPADSTGQGDFIMTKSVFLTWTHAWNGQVRTNALAGYRNDDYRGLFTTRSDDTASFGAGVNYQFRRWLNLGAQYIFTNRSSNVPAVEYDRNVIMFTLGASL